MALLPAFEIPSEESGVALTLGKDWASGKFGALKNILIILNLAHTLKITRGVLNSHCWGCTLTRLLRTSGLETALKAALGRVWDGAGQRWGAGFQCVS